MILNKINNTLAWLKSLDLVTILAYLKVAVDIGEYATKKLRDLNSDNDE